MHAQKAFGPESFVISCPETEGLCETVLSLPMHPYLDRKTVDTVASALRESAVGPDAVKRMESVVEAYSGLLGIDAGSRNFYILDGTTGKCLATSALDGGGSIDMTPNILTALSGREGSDGSPNGRYMDVAVPVSGDDGSYIIYIRDNKHTVQTLNNELIKIILEALAIGIVVSAALSIILSRTMLQPIQSMTRAAEKMAGGDFSAKIDVQSDDEIGILPTAPESWKSIAYHLPLGVSTIPPCATP